MADPPEVDRLESTESTEPGSSKPTISSKPTTDPSKRIWTVPNLLSELRLFGSPALLFLAYADKPTAFLGTFLLLLITDWFDGKLAKLLKQQTTFGARIDSYADATFYACTLLGTVWLEWDLVQQEMAWISIAAGSYAVNVIVACVRFRRLPAYHTRMAKSSWLFIGVAVIALFTTEVVWPLRVATVAVIVTNLEQTLITLLLRERKVNVMSFIHVLREKKQSC